ncbi:glutaredoxin family protein [Fuchsiella alkaliacetigena]|uniref:glutaredoxin family protein n=1 Tax=Fuchsiella alkaliacetigena TaxID=957042 RepID=UPI00200A4142|nr:glutaredoxin family protein [Fuchsiella alkaliacetigena]MCK8825584.1 glutaredoxin family protein [Fuchsiella alkaliacetigena]
MSEVVIYTTSGCPYCKQAKEDYREQGIDFKEVNLDKNKVAKKKVVEEYKADKVPVIIKDGQVESIGYKGAG